MFYWSLPTAVYFAFYTFKVPWQRCFVPACGMSSGGTKAPSSPPAASPPKSPAKPPAPKPKAPMEAAPPPPPPMTSKFVLLFVVVGMVYQV